MAKNWYVIQVHTAREDQVKEGLERRVAAEGLEDLISQVMVPTEKVKEIKRGTTTVRERKIYPGYVMVEMELNDQSLMLIHDTPGVGQLLGTGTQYSRQQVGMECNAAVDVRGRARRLPQRKPG